MLINFTEAEVCVINNMSRMAQKYARDAAKSSPPELDEIISKCEQALDNEVRRKTINKETT